MKYNVYEPSKNLSKYIRCFWSLESLDSDNQNEKERVFPDGCSELIFHFHDLFLIHYTNKAPELQGRSFIHGQLKKYMELEATGKIGVFSARFHPYGLKSFVDFDVNTITGKTIAIKDIWKKDGEELEDKIRSCETDKERILIIEAFLSSKLKEPEEKENKIADCVNLIIETSGGVTIEELYKKSNLGKRQFERKFISTVGLSPKVLSRIIRFNKVLSLIENKDFTSLTSVAYEGGFYDQSHFIKDFKDLTGLNPKRYFSENMDLVKFFNL
ncbi:helix-turn-helix transcriptional regulator [Aurantibacillus circumpalustris]|uniref:helix-turn-helix transcriptional regulator n=1 Tax=Aurantibacillus circumpalustris TaxID=3036359 RepID=UPI00295BB748|nr:helix-turn-helix transcriptional regulator [Aurantibacillus circumpalustris]